MLTSLLWLSTLSLATSAPAPYRTSASPLSIVTVRPAADTAASVALTAESIALYVAVQKDLDTYSKAHPELIPSVVKNLKPGATTAGTVTTVILGNGGSQGLGAPDYSALAQKDTGLAKLFTNHHTDPAQFLAIQHSIAQAISTAVDQKPVDSTTVAGKNVALVQAHRQELDSQWQLATATHNLLNSPQLKQMLQSLFKGGMGGGGQSEGN